MEIEVRIPDGYILTGTRTVNDTVIIVFDKPYQEIGYAICQEVEENDELQADKNQVP